MDFFLKNLILAWIVLEKCTHLEQNSYGVQSDVFYTSSCHKFSDRIPVQVRRDLSYSTPCLVHVASSYTIHSLDIRTWRLPVQARDGPGTGHRLTVSVLSIDSQHKGYLKVGLWQFERTHWSCHLNISLVSAGLKGEQAGPADILHLGGGKRQETYPYSSDYPHQGRAKDHSAYRWKQFKGRWKASDWLLISLVKSKRDLLKVNCFAQKKFADCNFWAKECA